MLASGGVSIDSSSSWLGLLIAFVALSAMEIVVLANNRCDVGRRGLRIAL